MNTVKKLGMIILMEPRLDEAVEFYKKLGLKLNFHLKNQWAECALGDVKVGLCPGAATSELRRTGFVLEVDDLQSLYEHLKDEGVEFLNEPVEKIHGIMVSFKDPGNNVIDLYQPTPEKVRDLVEKAAQEDEKECCKQQGACCKADA